MRLRNVVKTYSDHIGFPIEFGDAEGAETMNAASSLWTRAKKDITEEQYKEFYHHVGHAFDDPWLTLHNRVEGVLSYTSLLFVPSAPPFDLFQPERKGHVKLYVKRVFITDDCEGLLPPYLRFLRGVVDSEDLPLNISRETFQHDPRLAKMRAGLVKRVLDALEKKAEKAPEEFETFWDNFGAVLKEGIYEDFENRDRILKLCRFHSTAGDGLTTLQAYVERMKEGQDAIYTISGEQLAGLRRSPQLEGFKAKGVEVLLLTDPIDEFWTQAVGTFQEKPFKSAAAAGADLSKIAAGDGGDGCQGRRRTAGRPRPADRRAQSVLGEVGQGRPGIGAFDRQRRVPGGGRGGHGHLHGEAAQTEPASGRRRRDGAHSRTEPGTSADQAAGEPGGRGRRGGDIGGRGVSASGSGAHHRGRNSRPTRWHSRRDWLR